jgi:large subunit ribosomal protein L20
MTRVKRGVKQHQRRERILKSTKGFKWTRKSKLRQAKEALLHAWAFQFADRKKKKRTARTLWQVKINAAAREHGTTYSKLIAQLKKANIDVDRKILADIAEHHPEVFSKILSTASVK